MTTEEAASRVSAISCGEQGSLSRFDASLAGERVSSVGFEPGQHFVNFRIMRSFPKVCARGLKSAQQSLYELACEESISSAMRAIIWSYFDCISFTPLSMTVAACLIRAITRSPSSAAVGCTFISHTQEDTRE